MLASKHSFQGLKESCDYKEHRSTCFQERIETLANGTEAINIHNNSTKSPSVECLTDPRILSESIGLNISEFAVEGLYEEPPLVQPEDNSCSIESQESFERNNNWIKEEYNGKRHTELYPEVEDNLEFRIPPAPNSEVWELEPSEYLQEEHSSGNIVEIIDIENQFHIRSDLEGDPIENHSKAGQERDFLIIGESVSGNGESENGLERYSENSQPEPNAQVREQSQLSDESCGSYRLIKPEGDHSLEIHSQATETGFVTPNTVSALTRYLYSGDESCIEFSEVKELKGAALEEESGTHSSTSLAGKSELDITEKVIHQPQESSVESCSYTPNLLDIGADLIANSVAHTIKEVSCDISMNTTIGVSEITTDKTTFDSLGLATMEKEESSCRINDLDIDNCTSFDDRSSYHDEVAIEDGGSSVKMGLIYEMENSKEDDDVGIVDEEQKMSFQAICKDLEEKNIVSHLKQCHSGPVAMHPAPINLRQADIVVLNPQTGEVLGTHSPQNIQSIHNKLGCAQINILKASSGSAMNGTTGHQMDGSADTPAQPNCPIKQDGNGSPCTRGGGSSSGVNGNVGGTGGHSESGRQVYNISQCQIAHLTVFIDRALVCRRIRPRFNASEITEVLFQHLSPAIDKDSVRVEIRGTATILDVNYSARSLSDEEDVWTHTINELNAELRQCQRQSETLSNRMTRASKQRLVLDTFADNLIHREEESGGTSLSAVSQQISVSSPANATPGAPSPSLIGEHKTSSESVNPYDPRHMDTLHRFLNIYEEQTDRLDSSLSDTQEELELVQARMEAIEKELHEIELRQDERLAREINVLVEPRETGQVEMLISYVVSRCSWKPAYDIRIFNSDGTMKVVYYGMIQQATGEDWDTRSMALSTALPGTGGTVPNLGLQRVHFKKDNSPAVCHRQAVATSSAQSLPPVCSSPHRVRNNSKLGGFRKPPRPTTTSFQEVDRIFGDTDRDTPTPMCTLQRGSSLEVTSSAVSRNPTVRSQSRRALGQSALFHAPSHPVSLYPLSNASTPSTPVLTNSTPSSIAAAVATVYLEVPRPPGMVRCDNEPVRVTVGLLDLQPTYEYVTVPKRSLHAFLKATAVNRSEFLILPGQTNIYADNTFIGKSDLPAVAQGEEFSCNLGAEHGIKVLYRPLFKYKEGTGSGGKYVTLTFKQLIEVRNTFDRPIRLTVMDQVPVSGEDKIKVTLIEPVIKHPEKYDRNKPIRMNKSSNVEWDLDLGSGETRELTLKYAIEHPASENLDVSVAEI